MKFLGLILCSTLGLVPPVVHAATGGRIVLPTSVVPTHYRIEITPDAAAMTFKGRVAVDVSVTFATQHIVLNATDIAIDSAVLAGPLLPAAESIAAISFNENEQTATHGKIYRQASGLFALDYGTAQGQARALFTQFENSDARRFVPSWDEPARKATFELTVTVPAEQSAVSNMPIASTESLPGNLKRVRFSPTPKMSSYLLFFALGDFERVHRHVGEVDVGVLVKRGDTRAAAFALDAAAQILPYYDQYFGIKYPLPKLDLIAAPGSSEFFGAMENWGAIFGFEEDLLIDRRLSTQRDRQRVYIVIAHEMAHQWFGDLVTMSWWDDLWLNEGFASWMENKVTARFHPEWNIWLQSLEATERAMNEDARDGTHAIITPVIDVLRASGEFDTITYVKGAAVIRMLESYLGELEFRAGVRRYILPVG